jgi:alkyl hydroperoxide reductase subunit AhpF
MALEIYVAIDCQTCARALELADAVARQYPGLIVEVIDVSETEAAVPDAVFAVPTYVLDGRVVSLGNPSVDDLTEMIDSALTSLGGG